MPNVNNVVQETMDYEQFSFIESNREQSRGHIEALKTAFDEVGNLTRVQPILVNERYQIIDGQHRFTACKELGLPIYFTVVPGLGVAEARNMNILHRTWKIEDFARSYALGGDVNYQKYLTLMEDYGFNHSIVLIYLHNRDMKGAFKQFRNGEFVMEDEAGARERLDKLAQVGEFTGLVKDIPFATALLKSMNVDGYSQKHMLKKLRLHGETMLKRYGSVVDNQRQLEEIYNYMLREDSRIRLY